MSYLTSCHSCFSFDHLVLWWSFVSEIGLFQINAFGEDDNQQFEALFHEFLKDPVWQTEYGANVCSTSGAGGSDSKKSFFYSDPSCSNRYPDR